MFVFVQLKIFMFKMPILFLCLKCLFSGDFAKELICHIHEGHKDQFSNCPSCNKEQCLTDLGVHYKNCVAHKFVRKGDVLCSTCGKTVRRVYFLKQKRFHMRERAKNVQSSSHSEFYKHCDKCDKVFAKNVI